MKKNSIYNKKRLKWAIRRGMLELDVLLGNFLKKDYSALTNSEKKLFEKLLDHPDPLIFSWLLGKSSPEDPDLMDLINKIQKCTRSGLDLN